MPRIHDRQVGGFESHESIMCDAVPRNGVEDQALRRAHMREQTMARQAAERKVVRPSATSRQDDLSWKAGARERAAGLHTELTRINAEHQAWLREQRTTDSPESAQQSAPLLANYAPPGDATP